MSLGHWFTEICSFLQTISYWAPQEWVWDIDSPKSAVFCEQFPKNTFFLWFFPFYYGMFVDVLKTLTNFCSCILLRRSGNSQTLSFPRLIDCALYNYKRQLNDYQLETSAFELNSIKFVGPNQFIVWFASVLPWKKGLVIR